jgi:hypothetical protein
MHMTVPSTLRCVVRYKCTDVSEVTATAIIRAYGPDDDNVVLLMPPINSRDTTYTHMVPDH